MNEKIKTLNDLFKSELIIARRFNHENGELEPVPEREGVFFACISDDYSPIENTIVKAIGHKENLEDIHYNERLLNSFCRLKINYVLFYITDNTRWANEFVNNILESDKKIEWLA